MPTQRTDRSPTVGSRRSSLRVRNVTTGAVINLVFEGNLRRLTGSQLRRYLEGICSIPADQQLLIFNGIPVEDTSTGASLGLYDNAMLELRPMHISTKPTATATTTTGGGRREEGSKVPTSQLGNIHRNELLRQDGRRKNVTEEHLNQSARSEILRGGPSPLISQHYKQKEEKEGIKNYKYTNFLPNKNLQSSQELIEFYVEEENINNITHPVMPLFDIHIEETRLENNEYMWLVEQMQFETERMRRERELKREREELEYEANILEREEIIIGRRIQQERHKLYELQQWIREEMTLEAHFLNLNDDIYSHKIYGGNNNNNNNLDELIDIVPENY